MEKYIKYTSLPCFNKNYTLNNNIDTILYNEIYNNVSNAVYKRVIGTTERPIACLLSGGLDSSLIACLVNKFLKTKNENNVLNTFSIGLQGSEDLKYAKIVANHLKSIHHEIIVSEDDFFNAIPEVIKNIESYDTTTVRASVGNYLIGKYIKENSDCKVIFNGDGADELMGGYLYFKQSPNEYEFDKETRRLLNDIHIFDVLRSDRCISVHGLEPRTPFLDRQWVEFYLSIDRNLRYNTTKNNCEKYLIRKTFDLLEPELLPKEVLWRTKEAFSDGVSSLNKSWFEIIQEKINNKMNVTHYNEEHNLEYQLISLINNYKLSEISINKPDTYEKAYYRMIYNRYYNKTDHLIPYFWMPKFVKANDASARTLDIYKNTDKKH
jgi:asparagine synthase (glutamine-hydrolysing)